MIRWVLLHQWNLKSSWTQCIYIYESGFELKPSPSPKYTLFSKGTNICLMKFLIIMFPVCPIWFQDPISEMSSNPDECIWKSWLTMQFDQCWGLYTLSCFIKRFGKCTPSPKIVMPCTGSTLWQTPFNNNQYGAIDLKCSTQMTKFWTSDGPHVGPMNLAIRV